MRDGVVILEAVRTPIGKRGGGLSGVHSTELLGTVLAELFHRQQVDPREVEQVVGGCVSQVGMQSFNVTRTAWLTAGLPFETAATTVDSQCGSSQQALDLAAALIAAGTVDVAVACGVENMSRVPLGSSVGKDAGKSMTRKYRERYEFTTQFEGAERIAAQWGITRQEADEFGLESQAKAANAWSHAWFRDQVVPIEAPEVTAEGELTGASRKVTQDEGLRDTSLEALAQLKPVAGADGIHTAGTSSQISDGAAAVLLMSEGKAHALGLHPKAKIVDACLVATDPVLMLTGPIPATTRLLDRAGMTISDIDVFEVNEAFASVVLAWERELKPEHDRVNPNGGAIALGHALGSTGATLITKALYELERRDATTALVTMCCGGGLGTGTLLERT